MIKLIIQIISNVMKITALIIQWSDTDEKNDHHDDSKEDINNNKTNYSNDFLYHEDNNIITNIQESNLTKV